LTSREPIAGLLPSVRALNPDDRCLQLLLQQGFQSYAGIAPDLLKATFLQAANEIMAELEDAVVQGECVLVETVLSTGKYRAIVKEVLARGGFVGLIYVALNSAELAKQRVSNRVQLGGHDVPTESITARWHRSLKELPWFAARAHRLLVYDNSDSTLAAPPLLVAEGTSGQITIHLPHAIPDLTKALKQATQA
jgi:predicted ABC-type ATPase